MQISAERTEEQPRASRAGIAGWMLFDWAAQPFFTVITTFIFGPYLVSRLTEDHAAGQAAWSYTLTLSGILIALLAPIMGSIADASGARKPWIAVFAVIKILSLAALWYAAPGSGLLFAMAMMVSLTAVVSGPVVTRGSPWTTLPSAPVGTWPET